MGKRSGKDGAGERAQLGFGKSCMLFNWSSLKKHSDLAHVGGFKAFCERGINLGKLRAVCLPKPQIKTVQAQCSSKFPRFRSLFLRDGQGLSEASTRLRDSGFVERRA